MRTACEVAEDGLRQGGGRIKLYDARIAIGRGADATFEALFQYDAAADAHCRDGDRFAVIFGGEPDNPMSAAACPAGRRLIRLRAFTLAAMDNAEAATDIEPWHLLQISLMSVANATRRAAKKGDYAALDLSSKEDLSCPDLARSCADFSKRHFLPPISGSLAHLEFHASSSGRTILIGSILPYYDITHTVSRNGEDTWNRIGLR
jgi:hypothetical protein